MKMKSVKRGHGGGILIEEGDKKLIVAMCKEKKGSRGAHYQDAYTSEGVRITKKKAGELLAQYGREFTEPKSYLEYPLHIMGYSR